MKKINEKWAIDELKRIEREKTAEKKRDEEVLLATLEDFDDRAILSPLGRG